MSDATEREAALAELESLVQRDVEPTLTEGQLEEILDKFHARSWASGLAVGVGDKIVPTARNGRVYRVTRPGALGDTEPSSWPTRARATVSSGSATLEEDGEFLGSIYDVRLAARECFRLKMAKASEYTSVGGDNEQSIFKQCQTMAESFDRPMIG